MHNRRSFLLGATATAAALGLECELLTPAQAAQRYPVMRTDDLVGAIWLPGDGKANPTDLTAALAKGARQRALLEAEGVPFRGERVDMRLARIP